MRFRSFPRLAFARRAGRGEAMRDEGFATTILPHLDAAWTYARYLARDDSVAEDLVQEAFARAFRARAQCNGDGRAWLTAIVRRAWHDWLRERGAPAGAASADPVDPDTPHSLAERADEAAHLHKVLMQLPEPFRETVVLRELEDLSYREIALATGVPVGTVMSRLARGRAMLAAVLHNAQDHDRQGAMLP